MAVDGLISITGWPINVKLNKIVFDLVEIGKYMKICYCQGFKIPGETMVQGSQILFISHDSLNVYQRSRNVCL